MNKVFKIILLAAALMAAASMALSCGVDYTEEELCREAEELIEASYELNEIYFGKGLPVSAEDSEEAKKFAEDNGFDLQNVQFLPVTAESPYFSIDDVKEATLKVYSAEYSESLFATAFTGFSVNEGNDAVFARYMEDEAGTLTVRIDLSENGLELSRTYDLSSLKAEKMKADEATVSVDAYVDGEKEKDPVTLTLVKEEDGWRLDSPTY